MSHSYPLKYMCISVLLIISVIGMLYTLNLQDEVEVSDILCRYKQSGTYSYLAILYPNILYNKTILEPGNPIYAPITHLLNITFHYDFTSEKVGNITLYYAIYGRLASKKWSKNFTLVTPSVKRAFGDSITYTFSTSLNITRIIEIAEKLRRETGALEEFYDYILTPKMRVVAETEVGMIDKKFEPNFTISFPKGGDGYIDIKGLSHKDEGGIEERKVIVLGWVRGLKHTFMALTGALSAAQAYAIWNIMSARVGMSDADKKLKMIRKKYKDLIVEVGEAVTMKEKVTTTVNVSSFKDLVRVADQLMKPIIFSSEEKAYTFRVIDGATEYVYAIKRE